MIVNMIRHKCIQQDQLQTIAVDTQSYYQHITFSTANHVKLNISQQGSF
jgi:hypothetical protein